jgi:hypothetical protein
MPLTKIVSGGQTGVDRGACHMEAAADEVRKAIRSRASGSPVPGESVALSTIESNAI